jgi:hypothetical protein
MTAPKFGNGFFTGAPSRQPSVTKRKIKNNTNLMCLRFCCSKRMTGKRYKECFKRVETVING